MHTLARSLVHTHTHGIYTHAVELDVFPILLGLMRSSKFPLLTREITTILKTVCQLATARDRGPPPPSRPPSSSASPPSHTASKSKSKSKYTSPFAAHARYCDDYSWASRLSGITYDTSGEFVGCDGSSGNSDVYGRLKSGGDNGVKNRGPHDGSMGNGEAAHTTREGYVCRGSMSPHRLCISVICGATGGTVRLLMRRLNQNQRKITARAAVQTKAQRGVVSNAGDSLNAAEGRELACERGNEEQKGIERERRDILVILYALAACSDVARRTMCKKNAMQKSCSAVIMSPVTSSTPALASPSPSPSPFVQSDKAICQHIMGLLRHCR